MLLVFGNYWQHFGGTDQYNKWSYEAGHGRCDGQFDCRDDFFGDPYAISLYKVRTKPRCVTVPAPRRCCVARLFNRPYIYNNTAAAREAKRRPELKMRRRLGR